MLKNNLNRKGVQQLNRNELKKVTGGARPPGCTFNCSHRVNGGPLQFGCPDDQECTPYTCSDNVSIGHQCQPL